MSAGLGRTGIYMRLSRDDENAGESASIEHQRAILREFVQSRGGTVAEEYADDGYSGTDFARPALKRLLSDAENGRLDTVAVKDLSRFGRNYIQVGQYLDYVFPAYGVRFIAVGEGIDSLDRESAAMDMMPIMNVFNEWYAANTSKKIRAVLDAQRRAGRYTNWNYPYGYRAGTDAYRTAVIDEEAAAVVRRIFDMRGAGSSSRAIARLLTDEGIPNPAAHYLRRDGGKWDRPCSSAWCPSTVSRILADPTYTGTTVQHRTTKVSYKNHKQLSVPEDERIVKEGAHEPIVGRELWERVQAVRKGNASGKPDKARVVHALSGLLVCADCGKKLKLKADNRAVVRRYSFICRTYADLGKKHCASHAIGERELEALILRDIRALVGEIPLDEKAAKADFVRAREADKGSNEARLRALRNRVGELDKLYAAAFEARVLYKTGACDGLCEKYEKERAAAVEELARLERESGEQSADEYVHRLKKYLSCEELTRELCLALLERVTVEAADADGVRGIHIYYRVSHSTRVQRER